jgi:hypothetical protein
VDNVDKVLLEIERDSEIMKVRFSGLLDTTADMLEKHGFGLTKAFLLEKQGRTSSGYQARALLKVLEKLEQYPDINADRKTARLIIKAINPLQSKWRR